jgi:hypothetical protein
MGKSAIGIITALIFVAMVSGCVSLNNNQSTTSTKTFNQNGISFQYPSTWQEVPAENLTTEVSAAANRIAVVYDPSNEDVLVFVQSINSPSAKTSYDATITGLYAAGGQVVSETTTSVAGTTGYQVDYTINVSNLVKKERLIIFEKGTVYAITYSAPQSQFDSQLNNFNIIVNSFKVQ